MIKNINKDFDGNLTKELNKTLFREYGTGGVKESHIDYYNDFMGKVIDNNDPDKLGRCQIRVYALFGEEIPNEDLPWATPTFAFVGSKAGSFVVPPIGALVKVYFESGDIYQPCYSTKVLDLNNLPGQRMKKYPSNMVLFQTDEGDYFEIDRETGVTDYTHRSGTVISISKLGDITISAPNRTVKIEAGVCDIKGSLSVNLGGNRPVLYAAFDKAEILDGSGKPIADIGISQKVFVGGPGE